MSVVPAASHSGVEPNGSDPESAKTFVRELALVQDWNFERDPLNPLNATSVSDEVDIQIVIVGPLSYELTLDVELDGIVYSVVQSFGLHGSVKKKNHGKLFSKHMHSFQNHFQNIFPSQDCP